MPVTTTMAKPPRSPMPEDLRAEIIARALSGWSYNALTRWANVELKRRGIQSDDGEAYQVSVGTISYICRKAGLPRRAAVMTFRIIEDDQQDEPASPSV